MSSINLEHTSFENISSDSEEEQILIKNIETGVCQSSAILIKRNSCINRSQSVLQPWHHYFEDIHKLKQQLYSLVVKKQHQQLQKLLNEYPIELSELRYMGGWTLLHFAVSENNPTAAQTLLHFGLNPDIQTNETQRTALHEASLTNRIDVARCLVHWGADPNLLDIDRNTAIHFAVDYGYLQMTKAILASNQIVDLSVRNYMNMTPFNTCRNSEIFELLDAYNSKLKISASTQSKSQSNSIHKKDYYQSRLIARNNSELVPQLSRVDQVEKFLSMRERPSQKTVANTESVISEESLGETEESSPMCAKKASRQAKYLKNRNILRSCKKVRQNVGLAKQSLFETQLQKQQQISNYDILKRIGKGAFAEIFLVRKKRSSSIFAMKRLLKRTIIDNQLHRYVYAERKVYTQLVHPFLLHAHYCLQDIKYLYILMELCPHGDLEQLVRKSPLPQTIAKTYFCEAALALAAIHQAGMLYRDLKVANVLLDQQGHIKLTDFGLSKQAVFSDSFVGSVAYVAPELLVQTYKKSHGQALDWYLLGVFLYELLHGEPPFYQQDRKQMEKAIRQNLPEIRENVSQECRQVLLALLTKDPKERVSCLQVLKGFRWLERTFWEKVLLREGEVVKVPLIEEKQLRRKDFWEQQQENSIDCKVQWFEEWNYPKLQSS